MNTIGIHDYEIEIVNYDLREDDETNETNSLAARYGVSPSKSYLRFRLAEMLKTRLRYEPPCDLTGVIAVVYEATTDDDGTTPEWELVAKAFQTSIYRSRVHGNTVVVELEAVAV